MLWVVLGTAALVTAFVVVGVVVDRRVPLLPPEVAPRPPTPGLAPPVPLRERMAPGETAASAVKVPADWRDKLAAGRCKCGKPMAIVSDEAIRYDDRKLVVVRSACTACGQTRSVYLDPSG